MHPIHIENQDFKVLLKFEQNPKGGQPAKELAMVERTDRNPLDPTPARVYA